MLLCRRVPSSRAGGPGGGRTALAQHRHRQRPRPHGRPATAGARRRGPAADPGRGRGAGAARSADYRLTVRSPDGDEELTSERVVNAAGLESDTVAALAGIDLDAVGYRQHWWKGSYFAVAAAESRLLSRLVYPVPDRREPRGPRGPRSRRPPALRSRRRAPARAPPRLHRGRDEAGRLRPRGCGDSCPTSRTTTSLPTSPASGPGSRGPARASATSWSRRRPIAGLPGLVNLVGIDSPGLTSSLALAEEVDRLLPA